MNQNKLNLTQALVVEGKYDAAPPGQPLWMPPS